MRGSYECAIFGRFWARLVNRGILDRHTNLEEVVIGVVGFLVGLVIGLIIWLKTH